MQVFDPSMPKMGHIVKNTSQSVVDKTQAHHKPRTCDIVNLQPMLVALRELGEQFKLAKWLEPSHKFL